MLRSVVAYVRSNLLATGIGVAVGAVLVGGATLVSAHGGDTSLIHACVNKYNQAVRVVGADQNCLFTENAVHWNQQGPAGESGPTGTAGPAGATGATGATGGIAAATYTVDNDYTCTLGGCGVAVQAQCDGGDVVITGGDDVNTIFDDRGRALDGFTGWETFANLSLNQTITVTALCLDLGEPHEE